MAVQQQCGKGVSVLPTILNDVYILQDTRQHGLFEILPAVREHFFGIGRIA
jgi:hypothetical protein